MSQRRRNIRTQREQELADLEAAEQSTQPAPEPYPGQRPLPAQAPLLPPTPTTDDDEEPEPSRRHLVKHRAARAENEEEQFEAVYKRDTYYIDRTSIPRLKKLIKQSQHTKTALLNEALDMLFEKYGI
jgi:hypothetical protein